MKHKQRNLLIVAALVLLATSPKVVAAEHEQLVLNGDWDFTYTGSSAAKIPDPPPASAYDTKFRVPGRWDDQLDRFKQAKWWPQAVFRTALGPVQFLSGIGWHRQNIDIPATWSDRSVILTIGNAVGTTNVWLNGKHLGSNDIGVYTPYQVDLTPHLKPGTNNELLIAVDNSAANIFGSWAFLGNAGMASGLARPVVIDVAAGPAHIDDLYVRPGGDLKEVVSQAELIVPSGEKSMSASKLEWIVRNPKGGRELAHGQVDIPAFSKSHTVTWKEKISDIKPWSDREPNLYNTELRWISADGTLVDSRTQRFGLRRWSYDGRRLFLNGQPLYLRLEFGAYYFPIDGAVSTSKEYWLANMRRVKELGLNGINFAAQVCPVEMMEAADELGIILQSGDEVTTRLEGKDRYQEVWKSIVRTARQHPSHSIYGFGGELTYYEGVIEQFQRQKDYIKTLDPESLVMPQQAIHGIDYGLGDEPGIVRRPFPHNAERLVRYTKACDLFGHYSGGAFSHQYMGTPWRIMEDRFKMYEKPLVAHELFISASYLNPENMAKYTGRIPPYIYTRVEKDLKEAGLIDKWPLYFDHTSRLQHICRKYCLEKVRKCDELAGFELLGMTDMHFITPEYAVGILDEFLGMKPGDTLEGIRRYSNESVLLLDFDRGRGLNRCYWEGDQFPADIMVSLYGPRPLEKGTLTWRLTRDGKTMQEEITDVSNIANGHVSTLKKLNLNWPNAAQTTKLNLAVELKGSGYSLINDWDFWVFAKQPAPEVVATADKQCSSLLHDRFPGVVRDSEQSSKKKLRIVSKMSAADVDHLDQGGDVVLLGTSPFTAYTRWPSFYPAKGYRPHSNGGTIIAEHPIFAGHPNDGWNDWLFYPLMQGANSVLFDGAIDMSFDPTMELISSAGHVRRQALLFEDRVGKGRLIVCPLVFDMQNASCATFMDSLLKYATSDKFQPRNRIEVNELKRQISPPPESANALVDPGFEKSGSWLTETGKHEIVTTTSHGGRKSLKLVVTQGNLDENRNFASSVSTREIRFENRPRRLRLGAWVKSDLKSKSAGPTIRANFRYADNHPRGSSFSVSLTEPADNWRYIEKTFDLDGEVTVASVYVELEGAAGAAWIDDLFFGAVPSDPVIANQTTANTPGPNVKWQNDKFVRSFKSPVWYKIDNGDWAQAAVVVDREGVHTVSTKKLVDELHPDEQTVCIDLTPPAVTLVIDPLPEQEAGVFTAQGDATYTFKAADGLSGVASIEVSTDGKTFAPYTKPITLSPGRHVLQCRATDHAGNRSKAMTGEWTTGGDETSLELKVLPISK